MYYRLLNSSQSDKVAEEIARSQGLHLVVVTDGRRKGLKAAKILRDVDPEELLSLFGQSDYVVTDSFHGVAFSLLFEKRFEFVDFNPRLNVRGLNLLQKAGLEKIAFRQNVSERQVFNYNQINERLNEWKSKSVRFLESALEQAKLYVEKGK